MLFLSSFSSFYPPLSIIMYFQGRKPHKKTPDRAAHGYCSPGKGEGRRDGGELIQVYVWEQ
ncbi:hypothetical protein NC652_021379 [Populus alba x Populus x berolinensis]|nr:hypothetical protein NC652_021379 [Populus alba x Populus x berolinensis]